MWSYCLHVTPHACFHMVLCTNVKRVQTTEILVSLQQCTHGSFLLMLRYIDFFKVAFGTTIHEGLSASPHTSQANFERPKLSMWPSLSANRSICNAASYSFPAGLCVHLYCGRLDKIYYQIHMIVFETNTNVLFFAYSLTFAGRKQITSAVRPRSRSVVILNIEELC